MLTTVFLLAPLLRALRQWHARRGGASLRDLDARTLADIGVDASEIASIEAESRGDATRTRLRIVGELRHA